MVDASANFKTAAAHIRRGIEAKNTEIAELRRTIDRRQADTKSQIADIKQNITILEAQAANAAEDQHARAARVGRVVQLNNQISDMENAVSKERDLMLAQIKGLEGEVMGLEQEAKTLESKR